MEDDFRKILGKSRKSPEDDFRKILGKIIISLNPNRYRAENLINLGILTAVPAVSRALLAQRPGTQVSHRRYQVSAYPNLKVTVILSGDTFFLGKTDVRAIYVNSMSTS